MNFEKTVRLTSFQKRQLQSVLPLLFAVFIVIFMFLAVIRAVARLQNKTRQVSSAEGSSR